MTAYTVVAVDDVADWLDEHQGGDSLIAVDLRDEFGGWNK